MPQLDLLEQKHREKNCDNARRHRAGRPQPAGGILGDEQLDEVRLRRQKLERRFLPRQKSRRQAERRRQRGLHRQRHAEFVRCVGRNPFHLDVHWLKTQFQLVRQRLRQFARAKNADALHRVAQPGRQLSQRDAHLARHRVRVQRAPAGLILDRAFERAQGRHAAARRDLQTDTALANRQRQHA